MNQRSSSSRKRRGPSHDSLVTLTRSSSLLEWMARLVTSVKSEGPPIGTARLRSIRYSMRDDDMAVGAKR